MVGILTLFALYVFVLCVNVCVSGNKNLPDTPKHIFCALFPCINVVYMVWAIFQYDSFIFDKKEE